MQRTNVFTWSGLCFICLTVSHCFATEPTKASMPERTVDLFAAMDSGDIEAELIAPSSKQVYLRVKNNTKELLTINLPEVFGGVPVLAQFQPRGFGPGQGQAQQPFGAGAQFGQGPLGQGQLGQGGQGGGTQGLGGGFGQGQAAGQFGNQGAGNQFGNPMGNQVGRGFFRVLPGRVGKVVAQTVCLEHGKPDPTSKHKYQIVPIDRMPQADARITEICRLMGARLISQNVAQATTWHVTDGLSWEALAAKNRSESRYTGVIKYFSPAELDTARSLLEQLERATPHESYASSFFCATGK